uniref:DNA ligase n=1 Tax=Lygus hesperus TaxID=30085 RepID=A0A0A9YEQ4_LYGHE
MLVIAWNPLLDSFFFKVPATPTIRTKRELAIQVGRIGRVMPVSVYPRGIQRQVCKAKFGWDDPLPVHLALEWTKLSLSINQPSKITLPCHLWLPCMCRFINKPVKQSNLDAASSDQWLVGFADASRRAYAAVIYHVGTVLDKGGEGKEGRRLFNYFGLNEYKTSLLEVLSYFDAHCAPCTNVVMERYKFLSIQQKELQPFD